VGSLAERRIAVVCGQGNNGGDGFVIARHLANRGCDVRVLLLGRRSGVTGDARVNLAVLLKMAKFKRSNLKLTEVGSVRSMAGARDAVIIVDAILGTGFSGRVHGLYRDAIVWINRQKAFVASVDIASGVDATTGAVEGAAVKAHLTVTMGVGKIGQYVGNGADQSGEVRVVDISIPPALIRSPAQPVYRVLAGDVRAALPVRPRAAHKYSVGKVLVVGGSRAYTGAPLMTAQAAMKSGAGAVVLAIPDSIHGPLARRVSEVIIARLPETPGGALGREALSSLLERAIWADAVAIGPGLSRNEETMELVREFVASVKKPCIIDADGLFAFRSDQTILRRRTAPTIVTPHAGEFGILTGVPLSALEQDRVGAARTAAMRMRTIVVLKGAPTVIAAPDGSVYVNSTGNPGMATIGSGDVLTGMIGGLAAQGMEPIGAAYAGVFLHGLAGDIGALRHGQRSLLATDIVESIAGAFTQLGG